MLDLRLSSGIHHFVPNDSDLIKRQNRFKTTIVEISCLRQTFWDLTKMGQGGPLGAVVRSKARLCCNLCFTFAIGQ